MRISQFIIQQSSIKDLDAIFDLFEAAIVYQQSRGYDLWPEFEREFIENEITEGRHWKIRNENDVMCVFSVQYNDPIIWAEKDKDNAVYLHRITVNPLYKGQGMMKVIREWALQHAKEKAKQFVRMDTWGNNVGLREYYIACGFNYIGQKLLHPKGDEPGHYGGNLLSLFEEMV